MYRNSLYEETDIYDTIDLQNSGAKDPESADEKMIQNDAYSVPAHLNLHRPITTNQYEETQIKVNDGHSEAATYSLLEGDDLGEKSASAQLVDTLVVNTSNPLLDEVNNPLYASIECSTETTELENVTFSR